jgi:predicted DNA-binding ribbon-helix-helix protein
MDSTVLKRSVVINHHKTSVSLEDAFWKAIKNIAAARSQTLSELVAEVDSERRQGNLSSALRLYVLEHYRTRAQGGGAGDRTTGGPEARQPEPRQSEQRQPEPRQDNAALNH